MLGTLSLVAIWLDPAVPALYAPTAYTLLSLYAVYSAGALAIVWLPLTLPSYWPIATHVIDLAIFTLFILFTEGPTSPFFVYFVFSIMCGTLRWGWAGTVWTAAIAIAVFLAIGVYATRVIQDPAFELHRFVIRAVYLVVVASLVGYMGAHAERAHRELVSLAAWPQNVAGERQALLRDALARAAEVLRAPHVVLVWEQPEEPSTNVAAWRQGGFEWTREPPGLLDGLSPGVDAAWPDALARRFGARPAPMWTVAGQGAQGRLICLSKRRLTQDEMALGEIAARLASAMLDSLYLVTRLREAVASEVRVRLARNLHDSVVQSLAGVALQLQTARHLLDRDPGAAHGRLREMQDILASEQHRLRTFIGELRPFRTSDRFDRRSLGGRLSELCRRVERQWGMRVTLSGSADHAALAERQQEVYYLVNEALMNAARHAKASTASVTIEVADGRARIEVVDNGHGFPFAGRYDLDALVRMGAGPRSLQDRLVDLSGQLELESTAAGARLVMTLPVATVA